MRDNRGFTLIEVLVVVAIIGLVAGISIPNLLSALDRARQKRSMADIRAVSEAIEMYQTDHMFYPRYADVTAENLEHSLAIYVKRYNSFDGWNHAFLYSSDGERYTLRSLGSDGQNDSSPVLGPTTTFKADIIFSQGVFVQWPEGVQKQAD
jgi:general secretion pathway protein G